MTLFLLYNIPPHFPSLEGDGEVLRASNRADVQPAKEAADPGEGSPGKHMKGNLPFTCCFLKSIVNLHIVVNEHTHT